jgi:hypothetical protein
VNGQPVRSVQEGFQPDSVGPYALPLDPDVGNDMCDPKRGGFFIHGDSVGHPGEASNGCIIMSRSTREKIVNGGDTHLQVQPDNPSADLSKVMASTARRVS